MRLGGARYGGQAVEEQELRNLEDGLPRLKEGNLESSEVLPGCHGSGL